MARVATTADVFNAIAEPRRRALLDCLLGGERAVMDIVRLLGWPQAQVSKHLKVLRSVELVAVTERGRHRLYRLNAERLKPVHDWAAAYERHWTHHLDRIKSRAEAAASAARQLKQETRP